MDKNAIKKYAVWARTELITRVSQRAEKYDITADADASASSVNGVLLSDAEIKQRKALIEQVKQKGFDQVMEEVAYTWFNRFIALRFMEVNGYLPSHIRVFTDDNNNFKPQILAEAIHLELDGLDMEKVYEMKNNNENDELYKYLIITQCNDLSKILPRMFQKIADFSELLFPDNILREGSVIEQMISTISEEDWKDQVQIIGWMYQYYNSEPKEKVFADMKKNIKISKEKIPAATQLFTPDWIVKYMVENSLGRLWNYNYENSNIKEQCEYYVDDSEQLSDVIDYDRRSKIISNGKKPEDIICIDPCCGSGHILAYLFDVLVLIYEEYGVTSRDAVKNIISNNLWGLDIDDRAAQLAYFLVMMKAVQYDRRFLVRKDDKGIVSVPQPHVYAIKESNNIDQSALFYFSDSNIEVEKNINKIIDTLRDAREYGSIINPSDINFQCLFKRLSLIEQEISLYHDLINTEIKPLIEVCYALSQKYDIVVTNPPYMGYSGMNPKLSAYIKNNYFDYKADLFSVFMIRCAQFAKKGGYLGFLTPYVWMFIQSYEKMREFIISEKTIETLIQFEYSAFEEATVPICTFVLKNEKNNKNGTYLRLTDFRGGMEIQRKKALEAINNHNCGFYYIANSDNFHKIPGSPIAYWVNDNFLRLFNGKNIKDFAEPRHGMSTGNNDLCLKMWYEVNFDKICFDADSQDTFDQSGLKYVPYKKGGDYRLWYGNNDYVLAYDKNSRKIMESLSGYRASSNSYFFRSSINWSDLSSSYFGVRWSPEGFAFDGRGSSMFCDESIRFYLLGLLASRVSSYTLNVLNPTMTFSINNIESIPVIIDHKEEVEALVKQNIDISRQDWDSYETSWDFKIHPYLMIKKMENANGNIIATLRSCSEIWEKITKQRFATLRNNEEELNRIFIDIYGLSDELSPAVDESEVTIRSADIKNDIKSFMSYAVGCMFGRYSIDFEGIAYAGGAWDDSKYKSFKADNDGIIPITDDEYFADDLVSRFVDFLRVVFGEGTLEENLNYIAEILGGKGSSREVIRKYFLNEFYSDHIKCYQKRPIYWLFDSGKKNGFKCLVYIHKYKMDTVARIRTDYVHELQSRYRTIIEDTERRILDCDGSTKVKLEKNIKKIKSQEEELHIYEEKIHHLADQMIVLDTDDGVKNNYKLFGDVLAKIK
ncbi:BREX-1 system adenine-specific DNA-methyltransferase PglX [Butyrivibrio fibrisolvens]|uniref:BREX-1 system adenine-specific DNA-methyltransferase PglX n=1 Tax=Butyrivibrio fibrisolvens TaxID=831 RepID=UPI0003B46832|nr:BREX-1 system adenine-specific DNA-methyltransferase PglX [Butyrivibrio fibrisolvens]